MKNKIFASLLALTLALSLTACGSKSDDSAKADTTDDAQTEQPAEPQEAVTLNVAASPTPHAEILKQCVPILAEQGIDLQIHEYSDYVVPNTAVEDGDEDANYFQHKPYLDDYMELADCRLLRFPLPCQTMRCGRLLPQHPPLFPQRSIGKRIGQLCPATCPDAVVTLEPQGMVSQNIPLFLWQLHAGTGTANPQIPKVLCPRPATLSGRVAAGVERTVSDGEPPLDEIHEHPDFRYASHRAVRIAVHQHAVALLCFRDYRTRSLALLHSPCT